MAYIIVVNSEGSASTEYHYFLYTLIAVTVF